MALVFGLVFLALGTAFLFNIKGSADRWASGQPGLYRSRAKNDESARRFARVAGGAFFALGAFIVTACVIDVLRQVF